MTIGILGLGRIGHYFAQTLLTHFPGIQILAYAPRYKASFQSLEANEHFTLTTDLDYFLDQELDGYLIASPSDTHYDYINQLVIKEKPIFCEKPLDLTLERIERIQRLVDAYEQPLTVGFNRRFDPDIRQLKQQLQEGRIGTPHIVKLTSRDPGPPPAEFIEASGGLYLDMIIHDFDMARFLLEDEPVAVYSEADVMVDPAIGKLGDVDTAVTTLRFAKGTLVIIDNSRKATYGYDQRIEVFGSEGMITTQNHRDHQVVRYTQQGSQMEVFKDFFMERYARSYQVEMDAFLKLCRGEPAPIVSVQDAFKATRIALAAQESARTHQRVAIKPIDMLEIN